MVRACFDEALARLDASRGFSTLTANAKAMAWLYNMFLRLSVISAFLVDVVGYLGRSVYANDVVRFLVTAPKFAELLLA